MNDKYFTPQLEDFHVGFEYEFQGIPKGWHKMVFSEENNIEIMKYNLTLEDCVRVPFLTKEQIEAEGWITIRDYEDPYFQKGIWELQMFSKEHKISLGDDLYHPNYEGECKSINELRYILKLLKI